MFRIGTSSDLSNIIKTGDSISNANIKQIKQYENKHL